MINHEDVILKKSDTTSHRVSDDMQRDITLKKLINAESRGDEIGLEIIAQT